MSVTPAVRARAAIVGVLVLGIFGGLAYRLYAIQILGHRAAVESREKQSLTHVVVESGRGRIVDARGEELAVSIPVASICVNPKLAQPDTARVLSEALSLPYADVQAKLQSRKEFVWIKRRVTDAEADRVRALLKSHREIGIRTEYDRRYPMGQLAAHVIGLLADDRGSEGVERGLDPLLDGSEVRRQVRVDGLRRIVECDTDRLTGTVVTLTIVAELQRIVEEELSAAVAEHRPKWAVAVVMDPKTGAILALANLPTYDPNMPTPGPALRNLAIGSPYEPGSTLKVFFAAGALDEAKVRSSTMFDCENGLWRYGPRLVRDHHPYARLTLAEVIEKSSNIGAAKLGALTLGPKKVHAWATAFGFGRETDVDLPGESRGKLRPLHEWSPYYSVTSISFGQEISVTPLQLVTAMSALANGGKLLRPFVVRRIERDDGTLVFEAQPSVVRQVVSAATCSTMREILVKAVETGTGKEARVEGLRVAGKTGTTQLIDRHGRLYGYISSFTGFAPADDARLAIAVIVSQPQGEAYYGGKVAAPVVKRILERGLELAK